ncbi:MAG: isochorismate synthase [Actinomycetota bacterium]|nr:isochorismate synthase [Actinomycetota bacterium]
MTTSDVSLRSGTRLAARSFVIDGPLDLLDCYASDGFAWLDGDHGFVASGVAAVVAPADAPSFLATIRHSSADVHVSDAAGPRAVGALPFTGSGQLVVPGLIIGRDARGRMWRTVIDDADPPRRASSATPDTAPSQFGVAAATGREQWGVMVDRALIDIACGRLEKIVLARAVRIDADRPFDVPAVLAHLRRSQPGCIVYADRGFLGASPELLVRKVGAAVTARPLAGTAIETAALVRSAKDAHEHRLVVDAVLQALRRCCSDVHADGPSPLELADVSHLATTVTARADAAATSIADLVAALHPTPAVAGTPREVALDAIDAMEPVARGRYAGPCGWIDRNGDGEFVVALRGGEIDGAHAVIHAGAGIVAGSDPAAEWAETQQKLTPMLQALVRP